MKPLTITYLLNQSLYLAVAFRSGCFSTPAQRKALQSCCSQEDFNVLSSPAAAAELGCDIQEDIRPHTACLDVELGFGNSSTLIIVIE